MSLTQDPPSSLKRDHDSFNLDDLPSLAKPFSTDPQFDSPFETHESEEASIPTPSITIKQEPRAMTNSRRSSSTSLSEVGSHTPSLQDDAPSQLTTPKSAFTAMNGSAAPPAKKVKLSFQDKEIERINKEFKENERAEEKLRRDAEKAQKDTERRKLDTGKEADRQKKVAEKAQKEAEKLQKEAKRAAERAQKDAEKEADRLAKEEKRRKKEEEKKAKEEEKKAKEEEKLRLEEEKRKKAGKQKTVTSFFQKPAASSATKTMLDDRTSMSPAPSSSSLPVAVANIAPTTPSKVASSYYEKAFQPFFLKPHVVLAPSNRFERDEEATQALEQTIDSYVLHNRSPARERSFSADCLFHLSGRESVRGRCFPPVREIMAEFSGTSEKPMDLTIDSQSTQIKKTNNLLKKVPMKFLKFQEDVRPPYRGTYSSRPVNGIAKLARNPTRKDLPNTDYDYDSEAEWIEEDGETGEDLHSDGEEEELDGEDGDDMDDFLDNEGEEQVSSKRLGLQGDLEPISTGLCWEDHHKRSTNVKMMPYRMEVIIDSKMKTIDPFSTQYWEPVHKVTKMEPPRLPLNTLKSPNKVMGSSSGSKPVNSFFPAVSDPSKLALAPSTKPNGTATAPTKSGKPKLLLVADDLEAFKDAVRGSNFTKLGLIELLKKTFITHKAAVIKDTLAEYATRVGKTEKDKRWVINGEADSSSTGIAGIAGMPPP